MALPLSGDSAVLQDGMAGVCGGPADTITPADLAAVVLASTSAGTSAPLPLECLAVCALEIQVPILAYGVNFSLRHSE